MKVRRRRLAYRYLIVLGAVAALFATPMVLPLLM